MKQNKLSSKLYPLIKAVAAAAVLPVLFIYIMIAKPDYKLMNAMSHVVVPVAQWVGDVITWPIRVVGGAFDNIIEKFDKLEEDYENYITSVSKFLNGNDTEFINTLKNKMNEASENLEFEKAIEYREMLNSLEVLSDKQKMTLNDGITRDIFGYAVKDELINIQIFHMRNGKIIERSGEVFDLIDSPQEMLMTYIVEFYSLDNSLIPSEVLVPYIEDLDLLKDLLETKVYIPIKGIKKQLVDLVKDYQNIGSKCENIKVVDNKIVSYDKDGNSIMIQDVLKTEDVNFETFLVII